jgi:hypothetical protein
MRSITGTLSCKYSPALVRVKIEVASKLPSRQKSCITITSLVSTTPTTTITIIITNHPPHPPVVVLLFRILRTVRVAGKGLSLEQRQLSVLILTVMALVFLSAGLVQIVEDMDYFTAVYFMVVTMSTVGYGELPYSMITKR